MCYTGPRPSNIVLTIPFRPRLKKLWREKKTDQKVQAFQPSEENKDIPIHISSTHVHVMETNPAELLDFSFTHIHLTHKHRKSLLSLPGEIRNKIYGYVLVPESGRAVPQGGWIIEVEAEQKTKETKKDTLINFSLVATCRQIHNEALSVFHEEAQMVIKVHSWDLVVLTSRALDEYSSKNNKLKILDPDRWNYDGAVRPSGPIPMSEVLDSFFCKAFSFRNVKILLGLSPCFWRENEYQAMQTFVQDFHARQTDYHDSKKLAHHLHVEFQWRDLLIYCSQAERWYPSDVSRVIADWRRAQAVLNVTMRNLLSSKSKTLTAGADLQIWLWRSNENQCGFLYLNEDANGIAFLQSWKPGTAKPSSDLILKVPLSEEGFPSGFID